MLARNANEAISSQDKNCERKRDLFRGQFKKRKKRKKKRDHPLIAVRNYANKRSFE